MEDRYREAEGQLDLFPEAIKPKLTWRYVPFAIIAVVLVMLWLPAYAQEHNHPPEHAQLHEQFYKDWKKPDGGSCCNLQDCFPAEVRYQDGEVYAKSKWTGNWVKIPREKIDWNVSSPDGQSHACMLPPQLFREEGVMSLQDESSAVLCFVFGGAA